MGNTKIQWCDKVWNPVTGCTPVSDGCSRCYAERMAKRFTRIGTHAKHNIEHYDTNDFTDVLLHPNRLNEPLNWKKPRKIFVCSMGDLFHEDVRYDYINNVFRIIRKCSWHIFLVLTKRIDDAQEYFHNSRGYYHLTYDKLPRNMWLGVTAENQRTADERIPILLQIPAAVRFVSVAPMLGAVDLRYISFAEMLEGEEKHKQGIDWVVCGSESGQNRRTCEVEWILSLKDQCVEDNIPFFLKQMEVDGKLVKMPKVDGKIWNQMPEGE